MALRILAVTSEAFPLAKTGGLGDAVSGLAHSLNAIAPHITLLLPAYRSVWDHVSGVKELACLPGLPGGDATLLSARCEELDLPVLLLRNDALYDRHGIYVDEEGNEYGDNASRFAALAQAAARVAQGVAGIERPHVVHAHDWHAALTPLYMHQFDVSDVSTVLTLHNVAFQGVFPMELAEPLGIDARYCGADGLEYWGQMNFLKAGIRYADLITVVSGNYAREILTPEFGCGLEQVLSERRADLVSIANGIDTQLWNPQADPYLSNVAFNVHDLHGKTVCKSRLQQRFGLKQDAGATIIAMGSRLTSQKMADVAVQAIPSALEAHPRLQVCVLGQGEKRLEAALNELNERFPGRCAVHIGFDEERAHLLHAGADILLHGSRFEPFGLTPLYSMRYGTIPIGSRVGGMVDTINDPGVHASPAAMRQANGILFQGDDPADMREAIDRAVQLRAVPKVWRTLQQNAMTADYSWARSAPLYLRAYQMLRPDVAEDELSTRRKVASRIPVVSPSPIPSPIFTGVAFPGMNPSLSVKASTLRRKGKGSRTDTLVSTGNVSAA